MGSEGSLRLVERRRELRTGTNSWASRIRAEALWTIALLFICAHFAIFYATDHKHSFSLSTYATGLDGNPFQYRALTGWVIHYVARFEFLGRFAGHLPTASWTPSIYDVIFLLLSLVMLVGATVATRLSLVTLTNNRGFSRWASLLTIYMAYFTLLLGYSNNHTYPYDLTALFFFCLGVSLVLARRLWIYYPVLVLAVLNRETACLLILFFSICEWVSDASLSPVQRVRKMAPHLLAQGAIVFGLFFGMYLTHLHSRNGIEPSGLAWLLWKLPYNLREIAKPWFWPLYLSTAGFLLPVIAFQFRRIRERRIELACALLLPVWFLALMVFGVILEIRIFSEMISIESLAISLIALHWFEDRMASAGQFHSLQP